MGVRITTDWLFSLKSRAPFCARETAVREGMPFLTKQTAVTTATKLLFQTESLTYPMNDAERDLTKLLLEASIHHTRITMEELPIGRVVIGQTGVIESIDSWTENILDFAQDDLQGRSVARIFPELALKLFELMLAKQFGLAGQTNLRTRGGKFIAAQVVLIPAAEPRRFVCEIVFTTAS